MYTPAFTAIEEDQARAIVTDTASGWLVTATDNGPPEATLMPILWRSDRIIAHMAKANPHWRHISEGTQGLIIVTGPEAYISPSWYAAKAEHGKVVPTWNYLAVHRRNRARPSGTRVGP
jgi:transcriptional regulator